MAFRCVLLVTGLGAPDAEIDRAAAIAGALGAHLVALVLGVAPPPPPMPYGVIANDVWAREIQEGLGEAQARAREVSARLRARGAAATVHAQFIDRGTVATLAARHARYADLTLIPPEAEGAEPSQSWVLNGALFESGRPVLLLPRGETRFPEVRRLLVAWDASVEAAKAVRDALELMQRAEATHVVLVDPVPSFEGHGPEPGADLAAYLARHGVSATVHRLPKEGREAADVLRRAALELDVDLIVMGGFGHSRLRQRIFGGTTTSMMRDPPVPVLMSH